MRTGTKQKRMITGRISVRNLCITFCSIRPAQYSKEINDIREAEYKVCLDSLKRIVPNNYDLLIVENTGFYRSHPQYDGAQYLSLEGNDGKSNKGAGEISMLKDVILSLSIINYDKVIYNTGRKIFTCPYFFEKTSATKENALVCNPDFHFLDGRINITEKKEMFNDMIFAMDVNQIIKYAEYCDVKEMQDKMISSEQMLYRFIHEKQLSYSYIKNIGAIRNDWLRTGNPLQIENFHIV